MARLYTFLLAGIGLFGTIQAQTSDIVVFSDEGDKFTLLVDGEVKNDIPAARVVARDIKNATPLVVINFADKQIPSIKQNGWMEPGLEYTLRITTNKKGAKVLRMQGQAPLGTTADVPAEKPAPTDFKEDAAATTATQEVIATDAPGGVRSTTTTTVTEGTGTGGVNMSVGVTGLGVNVTVNDGTGGTVTHTTTTTTTTTTTGNPDGATWEQNTTYQEQAPVEPVAVKEGCTLPMSGSDFAAAKASIDNQGFDETKLKLAKQIAGSNCLSTDQVKTVMGLFGFEDSKLDFAKFAYDHVTDRNNYFKVNDAFGFSSSVDALNDYIQSR